MSKKNTIQIVDPNIVRTIVEKNKNRSDDVKARIGPVLKALWDSNRKLHIARVNQDFRNLKTTFPQFSEVIDYVSRIVMSRQKLGLYFKMAPILLYGPPGLGKTFFAKALADALRLDFECYDLSTASASFVFVGASLQWSEGEPGRIIQQMAKSKVANPIFVLDEIDKINDGKYSPSHCLLSLLEAHTAKQFKDEALDIQLNVSCVNWIATANDIDMVSTPLLSRFRCLEVRYPNPNAMGPIIQSIYREILFQHELSALLASRLSTKVVEFLRYQSPREVRIMLESSIYNAVSQNRKHLIVEDMALPPVTKKKSIGFL